MTIATLSNDSEEKCGLPHYKEEEEEEQICLRIISLLLFLNISVYCRFTQEYYAGTNLACRNLEYYPITSISHPK